MTGCGKLNEKKCQNAIDFFMLMVYYKSIEEH